MLLFIVASLLLVGFLIMLRATDIGLRLRALADNPTQFALYGYNVNIHRLLAFALADVFVTSASLLTAYDIGFEPHNGLHAVLLAVVAVIIGGRTSFIGPIVGGLLLRIIRAQVVWHLSARWQEAVTFVILALFLLLLPQGLFGRKTRIEVTSR
uniref:Branched-chain amino acid transport system / permease component n=1 Tax=Candidatus Kentrum sp. LPFa TaxID=2126335 RepID=A0A450WL80_9GAMM|nr:MAG: Branched-chain amino acid transport system / permease component [Candidatus Kentron sp. LPFa]